MLIDQGLPDSTIALLECDETRASSYDVMREWLEQQGTSNFIKTHIGGHSRLRDDRRYLFED